MAIHFLKKEIYDRIKAGEIIENPASIVRELLDNAIDAKADHILIKLVSGGIEKITVSDNGVGMSEEDLHISYLEHSTSKIENFEEIFQLNSFGFRGEALSAITKVSMTKITSSQENASLGHSIFVEGGNQIKTQKEPPHQGTLVECSQLFFNLPVRKEFLKSPKTEALKVKQEVILKALALPHISFKLELEKEMILFPKRELKERISQALEYYFPLDPLVFKNELISIQGYISKPEHALSHSKNIFLFVNNKVWRPKALYKILQNVFSDFIPHKKYPLLVLLIQTKQLKVDPNIHPAKQDIKILEEEMLFRALYHTLNQYKNSFYSQKPPSPQPLSSPQDKEEEAILEKVFKTKPEESTLRANTETKQNLFKDLPSYEFYGTVFGTYFLMTYQNKILLIDFHAAHERLRYEELKEAHQNQPMISQKLLNKQALSVSEEQRILLEQYQTEVQWAGFKFYFLDKELIVEEIPNFYQDKHFWEEDFFALVDSLATYTQHFSWNENWLKRAACRKAFMQNDNLTEPERNLLIELILNRKIPYTCPHGRPFVKEFPEQMIKKMFLR